MVLTVEEALKFYKEINLLEINKQGTVKIPTEYLKSKRKFKIFIIVVEEEENHEK